MMLANYLMTPEELFKNLGTWGIIHTLFESEMSLLLNICVLNKHLMILTIKRPLDSVTTFW